VALLFAFLGDVIRAAKKKYGMDKRRVQFAQRESRERRGHEAESRKADYIPI
jgi:hypothetical protein